MKLTSFAVLLFSLLGCNSNPVDYSKIATSFKASDTTGNNSIVFHQGESFDLSFVLTNQSGSDQSYHYTGVPAVFEITQGDSVIASSVDGFLFSQVVLGAQIGNGKTYSASWRAPNTSARGPKLVLPIGQYQAKVLHGSFFDKYIVPTTTPITFNIIR